jgi:hypothetical protein
MGAYSKQALLRDITTYTDQEIEALVDGIRERRLRVALALDKARRVTAHARQEKIEATLVKKYDQFVKMLEKIDDLLEKFEGKQAEILAIRLQLGEDITKDDSEAASGHERVDS